LFFIDWVELRRGGDWMMGRLEDLGDLGDWVIGR